MDPGRHFFHPIELHLNSGNVLHEEYFLLRVGDLVNGIVEEHSQVIGVFKDGQLSRYGRSTVRPKITWRSSSIEGRHLWMDQYFKGDIYCSDEFMVELRQRKLDISKQYRHS